MTGVRPQEDFGGKASRICGGTAVGYGGRLQRFWPKTLKGRSCHEPRQVKVREEQGGGVDQKVNFWTSEWRRQVGTCTYDLSWGEVLARGIRTCSGNKWSLKPQNNKIIAGSEKFYQEQPTELYNRRHCRGGGAQVGGSEGLLEEVKGKLNLE